ncbi:MAG: hypothetical protein HC822_15350 [Oscillochloris sp.]|nr:hypothetical protein [Oscillochloris sp.]
MSNSNLHPLNHTSRLLLVCLFVIVSFSVPGVTLNPALAQSGVAPDVRYDDATGIITIGAAYDAADPAEAPYVGFPSHPDAPKAAISIPDLAAALAAFGYPDLLSSADGRNWLLSRDIVINQNARLEVTAVGVDALRLDSTPNGSLSLTRITADGGHLLIEGVQVVSWDAQANDVDRAYLDGRSYLLALEGGRMDVIDAEVAYLGWAAGEPSGLSWRKRATQDDPQTGATGNILRSNIHDNYFGQYAYEAYGMQILNSEVHSNIHYGIDPHDYSFGFEVAYNRVYNNGNHGIIFSRGCEDNWIHHNEVYGNAQHGIMLDRGSNNNRITENIVYNNRDGIAIFQSSDNLIEQNELRDNERGIRINATYDNDDIYDGISTGNLMVGNTITNNTQYGIYLYERADKNIITLNTITGNGSHGVYIKTGENEIAGNVIRQNSNGIVVLGGANTPFPPSGPEPIAAESYPGFRNLIYQNTIEDNVGMGIQIRTGVETQIGPADPAANPDRGNLIRTNGTIGIRLSDATVDTLLSGNTIHANGTYGVEVRDITSLRNLITQNSIAANGNSGIRLVSGGNANMPAPSINSLFGAKTATGSAQAGATVEIYRDQQGEGRIYKGRSTADGAGNWSFALPADDDPATQGYLSVLAIDADGNTSPFGSNAPIVSEPRYEVGAGRNGELTVFVSGQGATITLPEMQAALQVISPTVALIENQGNGTWQANASLFIGRGVRLEVTAASGVSWLKLRSQGGDITLSQGGADLYNYQSFTNLRTYNGEILIDGVRVTSWDPTRNDFDRDISNGRSYLLAKYDARMDIINSEISYLGSPDGESYGIAWRDVNDAEAPNTLLTRVTGEVINSVFNYNYYGIYTYQAADMIFRGNTFHNNISYGFDPHDFSTNFLVEDNEAYENGNHGFIISRGCNNFTFRNNKSYNNRYSVDGLDRNAHGFMLDPGSPNSRYPQEPSFNNLFENNQAWGNDGYGLRILGSVDNIVRNNEFRDNLQGITLERGSTGNLIEGNTISNSGLYGIYIIRGSNNNRLLVNTVSGSGRHGIYVKTGGNEIAGNELLNNGSIENGVAQGAGLAFLPDTPASAVSDLVLPGKGESLAAADPELVAGDDLASILENNQVRNNLINGNLDDGIELKGASNTIIADNTISDNGANGVYLTDYEGFGAVNTTVGNNLLRNNGGRGIRSNGVASSGNIWSENSVSGNAQGGIWNTDGANSGIQPPTLVSINPTLVSGVTVPGATVEIYSDVGFQGQYFEGRTTADANGNFQLDSSGWQAPKLNAFITIPELGSSGFSTDRPAQAGTPTPTATATGSPTATATATAVPTASPSATATAMPTASPTPTGSPAPAPGEFTIFFPLLQNNACGVCLSIPSGE